MTHVPLRGGHSTTAYLVGSSRNRISGELTSSMPMAVRFFSPPEMPGIMLLPMSVSAHLANPSAWMMFSTIRVRSATVVVLGSRSAALR